MSRGLDHVVHLVRDLDAAGEVYDLLGFTVGARNHHPWGTDNRIVQVPGFFIELLQVVDAERIPPGGEGRLSFGAVNAAFLARNGEGLSMLALEGRDPEAEKAAIDAAGFGGFSTFDFVRTGRKPDGREVEVGFTLVFARDPAQPDFTAFTCTQRRPENFWSPDLQRHANRVEAVAGIVLVADDPAAQAPLVAAISGAPAVAADDGAVAADTPRGRIEVMRRADFTQRYGVPAPGSGGLRLAAVRFVTPGAADLGRALAARGMLERSASGHIVVPPSAAMGAALVLEPAP